MTDETSLITAQAKRDAIARVPAWFHSIDIGDGVVTPGVKSVDLLKAEFDAMLPERLDGQSVLDIGAWDGAWTFEAERRGAERVLSLDHYVWALDLHNHHVYVRDTLAAGEVPLPYKETPFWHPDTRPGKLSYDTVHDYLGSRAESHFEDFMDASPEEIGTFDVVLFLGVLYHVENPLASLRKVASLSRHMAIIETEAFAVPGHEHHGMWELFPGAELADDPSNWWVPNTKGLTGALNAVGFRTVEVKLGPPELPADATEPVHFRAAVHAYR